MRHVVGYAGIPDIGIHVPAAECLKGNGGNETGGRFGHDDVEHGTLILCTAQQFGRFVAGYAACQPQDNPFIGEIKHTEPVSEVITKPLRHEKGPAETRQAGRARGGLGRLTA